MRTRRTFSFINCLDSSKFIASAAQLHDSNSITRYVVKIIREIATADFTADAANNHDAILLYEQRNEKHLYNKF